MDLTERRDLRGGTPCWTADGGNTARTDQLPAGPVDVAIIGAGVMGTMIAERLSEAGRQVLLLDRRPPAHGSTAASTALVMWGADVPLTHLADMIGMDEAARRWRRVHAAGRALARRIDDLGIDCGRIDRPELYLAGTLLDAAALSAEGGARRAAGLPSAFLDAEAVADRFGIAPRAALLSDHSFEVDPVRLTLGLLERARSSGAIVCFPADTVQLEDADGGISLRLSGGETIRAGTVIIAGGYERATWFLPAAFSIISSYAIATAPGMAPLWRENALIWEASPGYIYARATADGRIVAGGEDEDFADAHQRDRLIEQKSGVIRAKLEAIAEAEAPVACAWSAAFGASPDGLPAIGRSATHPRVWLASGFGGNGVTFAALGADILLAALHGRPDPDAACFDPYRF